MITVKLQYNKSASNKIGKSLSDKESISCIIKESTSIVDPTIIVSGIGIDIMGSINYMTISTFNRSYFITDIVNIGNGIWEISGHCDVLESFKTEIKALTGIISRQENLYNLYLEDDMFPITATPHVVTKVFPSGFTTNEYVMVVAGK